MGDIYKTDIFHSFDDYENIYEFKSIDELDRYENILYEEYNKTLQIQLNNKMEIKKDNWVTKIKKFFKTL